MTVALESTYTYNKSGKPDRNLRFGRWEGCTGHVWASGKQTFADLSEVTDEELELRWKLSPELIGVTSHLKSVLATPIAHPDAPERLIGIVSLDSDVSGDVCGLASEEAGDKALQTAALLAQVLTLGELV